MIKYFTMKSGILRIFQNDDEVPERFEKKTLKLNFFDVREQIGL